MNRRVWCALCLASFVATIGAEGSVGAAPIGHGFTYQGQLQQGGSAVDDSCDFQFSVWDAAGSGAPPAGGTQIGTTQSAGGVPVTEGLFTVLLDFGPTVFTGDERWLQIAVRCPDGNGPYTTLSPRQRLSGSPYALYASDAGGLSCSGCVSTANLANAAITASKIATGTIQQNNLAFTPGTIASVTAGSGLTGGTITSSGTIGVAFGTTPGTVAEGDHTHDATYWKLGGNSSTTPGVHFAGTNDNQPLELHVNGQRALRLEPADSPNFIGGYSGNTVSPGVSAATIAGGGESGGVNRVTDHDGTVCGGYDNQAGDAAGSVLDRQLATVGGGGSNTAAGWGDTISGGATNKSDGYFSAIGGGYENAVSGYYAAVGGGKGNKATAAFATIGGGGKTDDNNPATGNLVTDDYGTIGGGGDNQAGNDNANPTDAVGATVGGGGTNFATNAHATVSGGFLNLASGPQSVVGGGTTNAASGTVATVPGGFFNSAEGTGSFAAGVNAHAAHNGSFVWSDGTNNEVSTGPNQFVALATGGFYFYYDSAGHFCRLNSTAGWQCPLPSDRGTKTNFAPVDQRDVLARLAAVPVEGWTYKGEDASVRHIGPMAQDFSAAFSVGEDDTHINPIDASGVAFAAIQGLYQLLQEKDARIGALEARLNTLEAAMARQP